MKKFLKNLAYFSLIAAGTLAFLAILCGGLVLADKYFSNYGILGMLVIYAIVITALIQTASEA